MVNRIRIRITIIIIIRKINIIRKSKDNRKIRNKKIKGLTNNLIIIRRIRNKNRIIIIIRRRINIIRKSKDNRKIRNENIK